ncbi:MAG TPA: diaminopimelate decarboxylase [Terriglobales bacterium]|nr:diaminopimelate decarboxylase [Terriglobales bacterium]
MRPFRYRSTPESARPELATGGVGLEELARRYGTPLYVYDVDAIQAAYQGYARAFRRLPHRICAAVKANANLTLLRRLAEWGSGFDVVSGGELERVLQAGGGAEAIVFSGVGKTAAEMDLGLGADILLFQVESEPELELLAERAARRRRRARFGLRVNPDIGAATHPHIATGLRQHKFGVEMKLARRLYARSRRGAMGRWLEAAGIGFHIGSQILDTAPLAAAAQRVAGLAAELEGDGHCLRYFDVGGGLGIAYQRGQRPPALGAYAAALAGAWRRLPPRPERCLLLEPGRSLFAAAGALLTRVLYVKEQGGRRFVITDAGANDLIRPSLYGAYHEIAPLRRRRGRGRAVEVVGPLCESGDSFAHQRRLPPLQAGDGLALLDAGAYGFTLSSNYNARPRAAEVAVEGGRARLIRRRERLADLWSAEL